MPPAVSSYRGFPIGVRRVHRESAQATTNDAALIHLNDRASDWSPGLISDSKCAARLACVAVRDWKTRRRAEEEDKPGARQAQLSDSAAAWHQGRPNSTVRIFGAPDSSITMTVTASLYTSPPMPT